MRQVSGSLLIPGSATVRSHRFACLANALETANDLPNPEVILTGERRQNFDTHSRDAGIDHGELARGGRAHIDDAATDVRAAIVDAHHSLQVVLKVRHTDDCPQRQAAVRRSQFIRAETFSTGGALRLAIPGSDARLHGHRLYRHWLLAGRCKQALKERRLLWRRDFAGARQARFRMRSRHGSSEAGRCMKRNEGGESESDERVLEGIWLFH